jgi:hypothetical protein
MNVNSLSSLLNQYATSSIASIGSASSTGASSTIGLGSSGADSATISGPGQLFSELQQLSQQNPTEFKAVASQIASTFQNAASQATGSDAQMLTSLANQFTQAAQSGTLQMPQPPASGSQGAAQGSTVGESQNGQSVSGHHHHHHSYGGSGSSSDASGPSDAIQNAFASAMQVLTTALQGSQTSSGSSSA